MEGVGFRTVREGRELMREVADALDSRPRQ